MPKEKLEIEKLEKWTESFKAIGHPMRLAIIVMLYGSEFIPSHKSLTFTQILGVLGLPRNKQAENSLIYHLDRLIDSGFIERKPLQEEPGKSHPQIVYRVTSRGQEFLRDFNLTEVIAMHLKQQTS